VHVAARAEIAAGAVDHDRAHDRVGRQRAEQVAQLRIGLESQRILLFGPVQRQAPDPALDAPQEVPRLVMGQVRNFGFHASRSSSART
jgi:hypothetical protein